jgi:hypothetical protein
VMVSDPVEHSHSSWPTLVRCQRWVLWLKIIHLQIRRQRVDQVRHEVRIAARSPPLWPWCTAVASSAVFDSMWREMLVSACANMSQKRCDKSGRGLAATSGGMALSLYAYTLLWKHFSHEILRDTT